MSFFWMAIYLLVSLTLYHIALVTTDTGVINRPLAALAAFLWPVSVPLVMIAARVLNRADSDYEVGESALHHSEA